MPKTAIFLVLRLSIAFFRSKVANKPITAHLKQMQVKNQPMIRAESETKQGQSKGKEKGKSKRKGMVSREEKRKNTRKPTAPTAPRQSKTPSLPLANSRGNSNQSHRGEVT